MQNIDHKFDGFMTQNNKHFALRKHRPMQSNHNTHLQIPVLKGEYEDYLGIYAEPSRLPGFMSSNYI